MECTPKPLSLRPKSIKIKNKSKKDPIEGVIFLSQVAYLVFLCSWISSYLEISIQVQQVALSEHK